MNVAPAPIPNDTDDISTMIRINCPFCGKRDHSEFSYGGEAHIARPKTPADLSDQEWGDYLFNRANPKGWHREQWCRTARCRRWFNAVRDTVTCRIKAYYQMGTVPPEEDDR